MSIRPSLSVIVPVLNEVYRIKVLLGDLAECQAKAPFGIELIVVDGGSCDGSVPLCYEAGVRVIASPPGRGIQLHRGACSALGDTLLFLHADTRLTLTHCNACLRVLRTTSVVAGGFELRFDYQHPILRLAERVNRVRFQFTRVLYGDHGLFLRRQIYHEIGGFAPWPLFEDVDFCKRLRSHGRIVMIEPAIVTSARRFSSRGVGRTFLKMALLHMLYFLGVSPWTLARIYGYRLEGVSASRDGAGASVRQSATSRPSAKLNSS